MADEIIIREVIDRQGINADKDFMIATANEIYKAYAKMQTTLKGIGSGNTGSKELKAAIDQLNASQKQLDASTRALMAAKKQMTDVDLKAQKVATEAARTTKEQEKAAQESIKTKKLQQAESDKTAKAQEREAKQAQAALNDYLLLSKAYNEAALKAKTYALTLGEQHPVTLQAIKDANDMNVILKRVDAAVGQHQRSVGDYSIATRGLGASFQQIARELPALAINANTFFLAISNNLPIFFDEVKNAKEEFKALKAEGKQAPSIFSALGKSVFSFNTLLTVGVTLLTLYGGKFVSWVASLFKGSEAVDDVTGKLKAFNDVIAQSRDRVDAFNKDLQFLQELSRINIDIDLVGAGSIEKLQGDLTELRQISIQQTDQTALLQKEYGKLFNTSNQVYGALTESVSKLDPEFRNIFASVSDVNLAIAKMEEAGADGKQFENIKRYAQTYEDAKKAVEDTDKAVQDSANGQRIIYRKIALTEKEINQQRKEDAEEAAKERAEKSKEYAEKERRALYEIKKAGLEDELRLQKSIADSANPLDNGRFSLQARVKQSEIEKQIIENDRDFELNAEKLTANQIALIKDIANRKLLDAEVSLGAGLIKIRQEVNQKIKAEELRFVDELDQAKKREADDTLLRSEKEIARARRTADERQKANNEAFNRGEIDQQAHQERSEEIEQNFLDRSLQSQIAYYKNLIRLYATDEDVKEDALNRIAELEKELSDKSIRNIDRVRQAEKQLNEDRVAAAVEVYDAVSEIKASQYDAENDKIQEQMDLLDERTRREIDVVNQTVTNQQERERKIAEIEARAASQRFQLEEKQRQIEKKKLDYEKLTALVRIAFTTAQEVFKIKAQAAVLAANPITAALAPFALAQIPTVLISGAAAAGLIAARKYEKGKPKSDNYEGLAIWGEKRSELRVRKDGSFEVSPDRPTYTYVEKDDVIFPDAKEALKQLPLQQTDKAFKYAGTKTGEAEKIVKGLKGSINDLGNKIDRSVRSIPQPVIQTPSKVKRWVRGNGSIDSLNNY